MKQLHMLVRELEGAGLTQQAIASAIGTTQPTICRIKFQRQRAGYEIGKALERLHASVTRGRRRVAANQLHEAVSLDGQVY